MGSMFLKAWTYIAANEHTFNLPVLIHYSSIDKVSSFFLPWRLLECASLLVFQWSSRTQGSNRNAIEAKENARSQRTLRKLPLMQFLICRYSSGLQAQAQDSCSRMHPNARHSVLQNSDHASDWRMSLVGCLPTSYWEICSECGKQRRDPQAIWQICTRPVFGYLQGIPAS